MTAINTVANAVDMITDILLFIVLFLDFRKIPDNAKDKTPELAKMF